MYDFQLKNSLYIVHGKNTHAPIALYGHILSIYIVSFLVLSHQEREAVYVFQCDASAFGHAVQWVFGDVKRNVDFVLQAFVKSPEQGAAA